MTELEAYQRLQEETKRIFRESTAEQKAAIAKEQSICPHLMGCHPLGHLMSSMAGIVWHELDTKVVVGICTSCLREFWPTDADYDLWRRRNTPNRMSRAGVEVPVTPEQEAEIRANGYGNLTQAEQDWNYDDIYLEQIKSAGVDVVGASLDTLKRK